VSVILRGQSATVVSYPRLQTTGPLPLSAPTAPEYRFTTAATAWVDELLTWSTGTVDATTETVAASADEGADYIDLADTTDVVVGRRYLLVDTDDTQVVSVKSKTATRVFLGEPLRRDVSPVAVLTGWAITASLTSANTDLVGPAVVQFRCVIGGLTVSWTEAVRVARRLAVVPLTPDELVRVYPEIKSLHARQDETLEDLILSAWDHVLMPRVMRQSYYPEDVVNADVLRPALAMACLLHVVRQSRAVEAAYVDRIMTDFDRLLDNTTASVLWHTDPAQVANVPREPNQDERNAARYRSLRR
jgi:hypothetical protein